MGNNQHKQIGEIFTEDWMKEIQHRTPEIKEPLATDKQFETESKRFIRIIGDEGAEIFALAFANNGKIEDLTIDGPCFPKGEETYITNRGWKVLSECFMRDIKLKSLTLSGHKIDRQTGIEIAEYLKENTTLSHIKFWKCGLDNKTASKMVKILLNKPNLENINLGENKITEEGRVKIENLLLRNPKLKVDIF